jgi:hypothetical protein
MAETKKKPRHVHCCQRAYCFGACGRSRPSCEVGGREEYLCRACKVFALEQEALAKIAVATFRDWEPSDEELF